MANIDIIRCARTRRTSTKPAVAKPSHHTIAMRKYRERYSISQYTLMLDASVKERYMKFCLRNGLSPSRVIQSLIVDAMDKHEAKSSQA